MSRSPTRPAAASPAAAPRRSTQWIADAEAAGYSGRIGLEYKFSAPSGPDDQDPFGWLPRDQRA